MGRVKRSLLGLGIAAALGAVAGVLLAPKKGSELRKEVKSKAKDLTSQFKETKATVEKSVKKIWGAVSSDAVQVYTEIKGEVLAKSSRAKKLTKSQYDDIVDQVVEGFSDSKEVTTKQVGMLKKDLKSDWIKVERIIKRDETKKTKKKA